MAAVFVGLLERIAKEIIGITSDIGEIVTTTTVKPTIPPGGKKKTLKDVVYSGFEFSNSEFYKVQYHV